MLHDDDIETVAEHPHGGDLITRPWKGATNAAAKVASPPRREHVALAADQTFAVEHRSR